MPKRADLIDPRYLPPVYARIHTNAPHGRTVEAWVTPCGGCGGKDFDLERDDSQPHRLARFCVPCRGAA